MLTAAQNRQFLGRSEKVAAMLEQVRTPAQPVLVPEEPDHPPWPAYSTRSMVIDGAYAVPLCSRPFNTSPALLDWSDTS